MKKPRNAVMTEEGIATMRKTIASGEPLRSIRNIELLHHINQGLKAHTLFKRDVDYIVKTGEVIIVDEFTGTPDAREDATAKDCTRHWKPRKMLRLKTKTRPLATITFQNFFRMYDKLCRYDGYCGYGSRLNSRKPMTWTSWSFPTNKPMIRRDHPDVIYKSKKRKL